MALLGGTIGSRLRGFLRSLYDYRDFRLRLLDDLFNSFLCGLFNSRLLCCNRSFLCRLFCYRGNLLRRSSLNNRFGNS